MNNLESQRQSNASSCNLYWAKSNTNKNYWNNSWHLESKHKVELNTQLNKNKIKGKLFDREFKSSK